jgi:hypothetical protein
MPFEVSEFSYVARCAEGPFNIRVRLFGVGIDEDEFIGLLILTKFPENRTLIFQ